MEGDYSLLCILQAFPTDARGPEWIMLPDSSLCFLCLLRCSVSFDHQPDNAHRPSDREKETDISENACLLVNQILHSHFVWTLSWSYVRDFPLLLYLCVFSSSTSQYRSFYNAVADGLVEQRWQLEGTSHRPVSQVHLGISWISFKISHQHRWNEKMPRNRK